MEPSSATELEYNLKRSSRTIDVVDKIKSFVGRYDVYTPEQEKKLMQQIKKVRSVA